MGSPTVASLASTSPSSKTASTLTPESAALLPFSALTSFFASSQQLFSLAPRVFPSLSVFEPAFNAQSSPVQLASGASAQLAPPIPAAF